MVDEKLKTAIVRYDSGLIKIVTDDRTISITSILGDIHKVDISPNADYRFGMQLVLANLLEFRDGLKVIIENYETHK
jgi:hypothetical protein